MSMTRTKTSKITKSAMTRWLSHDNVTKTLYESFSGVIEDLIRRGVGDAHERHEDIVGAACGKADITALGLSTVMGTIEFVTILSMLRDVLPSLAKLSTQLQSSEVDFTVLESYIPAVVDKIEAQINAPGKHFQKAKEYIHTIEETLNITLKRVHYTRSDTWINNVRKAWLHALVGEIRQRFQTLPLLASLSKLFTVSRHPENDASDPVLNAYFDGPADEIATHFSKSIPVSTLQVDEGSGAVFTHQQMEDEINLFRRTYTKNVREKSIPFLVHKNNLRCAEMARLQKKNRVVPDNLQTEFNNVHNV